MKSLDRVEWDIRLRRDIFLDGRECLYITHLLVPKRYRLQGLGRRCVNRLKQQAMELNVPIVLSVSPGNNEARLFWKAMNFKHFRGRKSGNWKNLYGGYLYRMVWYPNKKL